MNKKRYMEKIQEYEQIIQEKSFNSNFYNKKRLDELKTVLIQQLSRNRRICEYELNYSASRMNFWLMDAIENERSIQAINYGEYYIEPKFYGLSFKNWLYIFGALAILYFLFCVLREVSILPSLDIIPF